MEIDSRYMARALQLAALGRGHTCSNPMVGAVIVGPDGSIAGEGYHHCFGGAHAEVNAIASVSDPGILRRCTMYVTLEPCSHYGKTPPCAQLLIDRQIPRVVIGSLDPNVKVSGRGVEMLRGAGIEVSTGVMEPECRQLNRKFFTAHTKHRPYILLKWAMSADGYMDCKRTGGTAARFSNPLTQMALHRLRSEFDAVITGSGTVMADNPRLNTRFWPGNSPRVVVMDRSKRLSDKYKVLRRPDTIIIDNSTDLHAAMHHLFEQGITSVITECGPTLLRALIAENLYDEVRIEISPVKLGGKGTCPAPAIPEGIRHTSSVYGNTIVSISNFN